jgi:exopolysaccharide biosynthesis polyprenyl glycosylphosphotransferase
MLKEYTKTYKRLNVLCDVGILVATFFLGYFLRYQITPIYSLHFYVVILPLYVLSWIIFLWQFGIYNSFRLKKINELIFKIFQAMVCAFLTITALIYLFKIEGISRLLIVLIQLLSFSFLSLKTIFILRFFHYIRKKGYDTQNILVLGTGKRVRDFLKKIKLHKEWGINVLGLVDTDESRWRNVMEGYKVLETLGDVKKIIHTHAVDSIVCFIPAKWLKDIEPLVEFCEIEGVNINVAVDLYDLKFFRPQIIDFVGFPLVSYQRKIPPTFWLGMKRAFDIVVSLTILLLSFPLLVVISVLIKLTSKGPVFFKQERYGLNGRVFYLYKFRTMVENAAELLPILQEKNEMQGPAFKIENDPRVTKIGKFLRKFSIDEFPQFCNILKGDMSIVGPRPPIVKEVTEYDDWQRRRLRVRPGLTCLWQISGRNKIKDFNHWVKLDLDYIDNWSIWLDLKIFLKTIPVVISGNGAK